MKFGDKSFDDSIKQIAIAFLFDMLGLFDASTTDDANMTRLAFPYIHAYFIQLLPSTLRPKRKPKSTLMDRSLASFFTLLSLVNYGRQFNEMGQTQLMMHYCHSCIVLAQKERFELGQIHAV